MPQSKVPRNTKEYYQEWMIQQGESPKSSQSSDGMSDDSDVRKEPEARKFQSAARAAKRQRGRERRKMFKAEAKLQNQAGVGAPQSEKSRKFEVLAAVVAAESPLVVRRTFVDVDEPTDSFNEDVNLPTSFFKSTKEIDEWRRDYRKFRMGHHQGAKGEITSLTLSSNFAFPCQSSICSFGPSAALAA
jgi:hypothetical protein